MPTATNLGREVTYVKGIQIIKSYKCFNHVVYQGLMTNKNHYISITKVIMVTKPGKMATDLDGLRSIKLHEYLIMWSYRSTWQTKTVIFLLPRYLWPPNLAEWSLTLRDSKPWSHIMLWSRRFERSRDKQKPFYLYYQSALDHQI